MKDNITNISVPVKYEMQPFDDDRFKKCKVLVMHDGLNLNGSIFSMDAIEKAKESIKNIPILGFIRQNDGSDEADFGGHESEIILSNDGIKFRYLGRPIGIIPADANDYHYEIYDDKTYVAVTGYIWTDYANEALDILESSGEKGQSMEIRVDDGDWDINDNFNITSYRYTGLTILGDNVTPAMTGAKVQLFSKDESKFSEEYFTMVDELNLVLKNYALKSDESEVTDVEKEKDTTKEKEEFEQETNSNEEGVESQEETPKDNETFEQEEQEQQEEQKDENVDYSAQIFELNKQLSELQNKYSTLENEVINLRSYKATKEAELSKEEKEAVFTEFSVGLTDDEMKSLKDEMDKYTVNEITEKLNAIFTKKNLSKLKAEKFTASNQEQIAIIAIPEKEDSKSRYAV